MKRKNIPELLVIVVCLVVLAFGVSQKEGYHQDEILSYEMANAKFNPWIVPTQPQGRLAKFVENEIEGDTLGETLGNLMDTVMDVLQNRGNSKLLSYQADVYEEPVWISSEDFEDYITVDDNDAFAYLSVYFNVKDDTHPPFYYLLLHTMSSIFQDSAEPFIGCLINMAAMVGVMILLMKLGAFLAKTFGMEEQARWVGILAALCYGLSVGAMATTLLNRMYAVVTFFCVAFLAVHVKKWAEKSFDAHNKILIAVTVLGFLTQYFFLFYCLVLAAVTAVLLWKHKRTRELFCYVRSMVIAAVLGVALFPFSILHVLSGDRGVEALGNLTEGLSGYGSRLAAFAEIVVNRTFGGVVLIALVVVTVVVLVYTGIRWWKNRKDQKAAEKGAAPLFGMLLIPTVGYFLLAARMSPYLVDRYIMPLFPLVILQGVLLLCWLTFRVAKGSKKPIIAYVVLGGILLGQVWNLIQYDEAYYYEGYQLQRTMAEELSEYSCICVYGGVSYYENLLEFMEYDQTLLLTLEELKGRQEKASITDLEQVVLLVKPNVDLGQVLEIMETDYGFIQERWVIRESAHGDSVILLKKS